MLHHHSPWKHCAVWKKPVTKGHVINMRPFVWKPMWQKKDYHQGLGEGLGFFRRWCQYSLSTEDQWVHTHTHTHTHTHWILYYNKRMSFIYDFQSIKLLYIYIKDLFVYFMYRSILSVTLFRDTRRGHQSDFIADGCEPPCGLLGIELRTSARAVTALNHWAISSAQSCYVLNKVTY